MNPTYSPLNASKRAAEDGAVIGHQYEQLMFAFSRRAERIAKDHGKRLHDFWTDAA